MQGCHQKWEGSRDPLAVRPFCASCFVNCDQLKTENKYFLTDSNIIVWLTKVINCNKYVTRCWKSHLSFKFQIFLLQEHAPGSPPPFQGGLGAFSLAFWDISLICFATCHACQESNSIQLPYQVVQIIHILYFITTTLKMYRVLIERQPFYYGSSNYPLDLLLSNNFYLCQHC